MSIETRLPKLPHSVGVLCVLCCCESRRVLFAWVFLQYVYRKETHQTETQPCKGGLFITENCPN